jgi:ribonuclease P protein component
MIARKNRFHGLGSLRPVYKQGKTVRSVLISIRYAENGRRDTYRCAVVVSKKVHKSAVVRNHIRRRIYETIRLRGSDIKRPYDIVVSVFDDKVEKMTPDELSSTIYGLLSKAGMLS